MTAVIDIDATPEPATDARLTREAVDRLRRLVIVTGVVVLAVVVAATALILVTRPKPSPLAEVQATCKVGLLDRDGALVVTIVRPYALAFVRSIDGDDPVLFARSMACLIKTFDIPDQPRERIFDLIGQAMMVTLEKPIDATVFWSGYSVRATAEVAGRLRLRFSTAWS